MARRLFLVVFLVTAFACKSTSKAGKKGAAVRGGAVSALADRDPIERALLQLGVDGRVLRMNLNDAGYEQKEIYAEKAWLLSDLLVIEDNQTKPSVYALRRNGLEPRWVTQLIEPTEQELSENVDTTFFVSRHYLTALASATGRRVMQYVGGALDGLARPPLELPFLPTGSAAGSQDTVFIPSLGSPDNNKMLESFSLVSGQRGWGWRTPGNLLTSPVVSGDISDPKIYFVTDGGVVVCLDGANYAYAPRGARWTEQLGSGVKYGVTVTADTKRDVGGVFVVDRRGVVYCLDRITGVRRWVVATEQEATGMPSVFGDLCVVPMKGGLWGFHKDGLRYSLTVKSGPNAGTTFRVTRGAPSTLGRGADAAFRLSDAQVADSHAVFEVVGENLTVVGTAPIKVNGLAAERAPLRAGDEVTVGGTVLVVGDPGAAALWRDLKYDGIVARIGDRLVARKGTTLTLLHASTGEAAGAAVQVPGGRLFPSNTSDGNLFVVGGNATLYALFPR